VLFEMSNLLNCGLDKQSLSICVELIGAPNLSALRPPPSSILISLPSALYPLPTALNLTCFKTSTLNLKPQTESGVNPEALAAVVKELRREGAALRQAER
jgi:mitotic-spindle organizing protein 1